MPVSEVDLCQIATAFADRVAAQPDATALVDGDVTVTYAGLYAAALRVADGLRAMGIGPGDPVGLAARREWSTIVGMFGILLADAGFVPIDPNDPPERIGHIATTIGLRVAVTQPRDRTIFSGAGLACVSLETTDPGPSVPSADPPPFSAGPDDLAYVIHTSGSTGRPKGVGISRRSLEHFYQVATDHYGFTAGDRVLQFVSMSFDSCILEIFPPLLAGSVVILRTAETISSPGRFLEDCVKWGITALLLPTAYWHELTDGMSLDRLRLPEAIRLVAFGGEALRVDRVTAWQQMPGHDRVRLVSGYGPSETTVLATVDELFGPLAEGTPAGEPTIGRPLRGVGIRIVDHEDREVPPGDEGELLVIGPTVGTGYLGQPDLTARKFGVDAEGTRFYRTGDRARLRLDGRLAFLGRIDRQVKVRGFRVEPTEVEQALLEHPRVRDAAVHLDRERAALVGYLVLSEPGLDDVWQHVRSRLPAYSVPSVLVPVPVFPRNHRDKIDFAALSALATSGPVEQMPSSPPQGDVELRVAAIFAQVLGQTTVGRHDSVFDLGAHSLTATQIITRVAREFGPRLELAELYRRPTVAGIAALVGDSTPSAGAPGPVDPVQPLTPFQRDIWLAEQFYPGTPLHTVGRRYRITGPVEAEAVRTALDALVRRHDALRAVFRSHDDEPVMVFGGPARPVPLEIHDLTVLAAPQRSARAEALRQARGHTVLDPTTGALIAATLLRTGPDEWELVLAVHHLAFDGWSGTVIAQDLSDLLGGAMPASTGDFAAHLAAEATRTDTEVARLREHWIDRLTGLDAAVLVPADHPRPPVRSFRGGVVERAVDAQLLARTATTARASGTTTATVVLAALQSLVSRLTASTDITVLTPVAHRTDADRERTVGAFVTVVPLRTDLSGDPDVRTVLARANESVIAALDHDDPPLAAVLSAIGAENRSDRSPLTQVMLIVQNTPPATARSGDVAVTFIGGTFPGMTKLDLTVVLENQESGPVLLMEYAADLFEPATARRFLDSLVTLLDAAVSAPSTALSRLPVLSRDQRAEILLAGVAPSPAPVHAPVHRLVSERARHSPDAPAVSMDGTCWTYRRLEAESGRLAAALHGAGIRKGDRVGLCLPRGPLAIAAVLAAWQVGAAYVPVDPEYPQERRQYLLKDGDVRAVLGDDDFNAAVSAGTVVIRCEQAPAEEPPPPAEVDDADPAYVLYTSGTTGQPKGVVVTHGNLRHAAASWRDAYRLEPGLAHLQAASLSFDVSVGETVRALSTGGHLVIAPTETLLDPGTLYALLRVSGIAVAEMVPTVLRRLMDHVEEIAGDLTFMQVLIGGAEKWYVNEFQRAQALVGPAGRVVNSYGVTEATVDNAYFDGPVDQLPPDAPLPIGRPYPGNRLYVLDSSREIVPYGTVGQLWVGGAGVALGYHSRPELTAERFCSNPFGPGRIYRTGDSARMRADATVELLGRLDDQVKVNGHRIESGEVEAALAGLTGVRAAAADVRGGRLVGYLVAEPSTDPAALAEVVLRRAVQDVLAHHAVPARFIVIPELPLSPNGKVDRRLLPDPPEADPQTDPEAVAQTPTEQLLATIWGTLLQREQIGRNDSFFELGGDSFIALRLVRAIEAEHGVRLALLDLYRNPVLQDLANHLDTKSGGPDAAVPDTAEPLLIRLTAVPRTAPEATLICLPYAGGQAFAYEGLARALPPTWAAYALQVPGRDWSRPDEPVPDFDAVVDGCLAELRTIPGPLHLYGHSLGDALTVELARRAERARLPLARVVIGGMFPAARLPGRAFDWIYRRFNVDRLVADRIILDQMRSLGMGFDEAAGEAERAFIMRAVRQDSRDSEEYFTRTLQEPQAPKLRAPLLCVIGERDRFTELYDERYTEWRFFAEHVDLVVIPKAGHGFIRHQTEQLGDIITTATEPAIEDLPVVPPTGPEPSLRRFGVVATGQLVSLVGGALSQLVMSLWVYQRTGQITDFAFISAVSLLPGILAGPFAGAVVDRYDRRKVMIISDSAAGAATLALIGLMSLDDLQLWHVYALCAATSLASAFQRPAFLAAVSQLVPKAYLGHASGISQLGTGTGALFAPMLAAVLLSFLSVPAILMFDVASFLIAALALLFVRFPDRMFKRQEERFRAQILGGWRYVTRRPGLVSAIWFFSVDHAFFTVGFVLIVPMVLMEHGIEVLGVTLTAAGAGSLVGAIGMSIWGGTRRRTEGMIVFMTVNTVGFIAVGLTREPWLIVAGMFAMSATESVINGHWTALVQAKVGLELQGRVLSIFMTIMMLTMPIGYVLVGPAADRVFQPMLSAGGVFTGPLGPLFGTGPGRGLALVIVVCGLARLLWTLRGWYNPRFRLMEDDLPDALPGAEIVDKDTVQRQADAHLAQPGSR